jgi:hypothetical protein
MSAKADERAFVLYDWMAGYGAEPTLERPTDDARERRFVADRCLTQTTYVAQTLQSRDRQHATRYGRSSMQDERRLADPTRSHVRCAASIVCPRTAVAQPILSVWMDAARMMTGNFNRSTSRQYLLVLSVRATTNTKEISRSGWHQTLYVWHASMHPLA